MGSSEHKQVHTRYPVLPIIVERWSPRSFTEQQPEPEKLRSMFEAARLAPSAHNTQPPRFLIAERGRGDSYERLFACMSDGNQEWVHRAQVLVLACALRERFSPVVTELVPYPHAMHDLGLAVMSFILQGQSLGLSCHPLAGFDPDRAAEEFDVPELFAPGIVIAVGYVGEAEVLEGELLRREQARRKRRLLEETVFEGTWGRASTLFADPDTDLEPDA